MTPTILDAKAATADQNGTVIPDVSLEDSATPVREGDAKTASRLVIDNSFIDPDNSCELCTRMVYTPGSNDEAGIAYRDDTVDLGDTQRIVFFAKGDQAQEVSFVAAGNNTSTRSTNDTDMFPRIDFAVATENVTLKPDWQRFEIAVNSTALSDATYPFGVQMAADNSQKQTFYLKGVTADSKAAVDPLPTSFDSLNATSVLTTENMSAFVSAPQPFNTSIDANGTSSPAPATIEFTANTTGGLGPYSLSWDFNDESNNTGIGENVSHTFDKPGHYNVSLAAKDSSAPTQNASAAVLVTVLPPGNNTVLMNGTQLIPNANVTTVIGNISSSISSNSTADSNNNTAAIVVNDSAVNSSLTVATMDISNIEHNSSGIEPKATISANLTAKNANESPSNSSLAVTNHAPVAGDQMVVLAENGTASIQLRGSDQDDDPITFRMTTDALKGTISGFDKKTGSLTYLPNSKIPEGDSFAFKVVDNHGAESNPGRVLLSVNPVQPLKYNARPLSTVDVSVATAKNEPVTIKLISFSEQNTGPLKFSVADSPSHGKLSEVTNIDQKSAGITYYPADGYSGSDVFKFNVDDLATGEGASGKVSITVFEAPPNDSSPPVPGALNVETDQSKIRSSAETKVDSPSVSKRADVTADQNLTREFTHESLQADERLHNEPAQTPSQSTKLVNHDPTANAGQDRTVYEDTNDVTLKGTGKDSDGDRLSYSWEQIAGDPIIILRDANTAKLKFDAPEVSEDKVFTFGLTVSDNSGAQAKDSVNVIVKNKPVIEKQIFQEETQSIRVTNQTSPSSY
jgi:PKD repeat protein